MKLSNFRKEQNLTQVEMARYLHVSFSHYSKIEAGIRNPSYNFLVRFKEKFPDAQVDDIFFQANRT
ncbi:helix-turn-helix domain-containing protein [Fusibacter sp. JL216-2]|uniref:helix-turn-helix domain-containing protein n=1 Tax=Fusibacter sp. JL216-2 TaxID=3071453 RepID=UPI003D358EB3